MLAAPMLARVLTALALTASLTAVPAARATAPRTHPKAPVVGCADRSIGSFTGVVGDPASLRVGPLWLAHGGTAAADAQPGRLRDLGWWKMPALLRRGHTATLRIAASHRRLAGFRYGPPRARPRKGVPRALRRTYRAITLSACEPRARVPDSTVDGYRMTFWSGGIVFARVPLCVPIEVWIDEDTKPRRRTLALGAGRDGCR